MDSKAITDTDLEALLSGELVAAQGSGSDDLVASRLRAMNYYLNRPRGDEVPGRSVVQSSDVSDMVEAVMAQVMPSFAGDSIVEFEPMSEGDETQAEMESELLSQVVVEDNRGFIVFTEAVKDALLLKTGVISVWVENNDVVKVQSYEGLNEIELQQVMQAPDDKTRVEVLSLEPGEDGEGFDARIRYTVTNRRIRIESIGPEQLFVQDGFTSIFLDDARFVAERMLLTRSELVDRGFSKSLIYELPPVSGDTKADAASRQIGGNGAGKPTTTAAEDLIECFRCFYRVDLSGSGTSELIEAWIGGSITGGRLLDKRPAQFIPYACGTPFLNPHSFTGYSLADKLFQTQDVKTSGLRQWLDNTGAGNNSGYMAVENMVNMDDLMNPRPGRIIRVKDPNAVIPIPFNDVGPSIQSLLAYADQGRSERGGASLDLQNAGAQITSDTAHGVERQYTARELLAGMVTRTLAETLFRTTYLIAHRVLRSSGIGKLTLRKGGEWIETDPAQWPERTRINIKVGLSPAERNRKQAMLTQALGYQLQLMQGGLDGTMVTPGNIHKALMDWGHAGELDNPLAYFTDPDSPDAQKAGQAKAKSAQDAQAKADAKEVGLLNHQFQLQGAFTALDQWKTLVQTQQKYFSDLLSSAVEEMKAGVTESVNNEQGIVTAVAGDLGIQARESSGAPGNSGAN